jgi:hypothetical protein
MLLHPADEVFIVLQSLCAWDIGKGRCGSRESGSAQALPG